jgi:hypothetical protein
MNEGVNTVLRRSFRLSSLSLLAGFLAVAPATEAKNKRAVSSPKDEIEVAGHIAVSGGPVRSFLATQHYNSFYLYAQRGAGNSVTLIDVTKTDQPAVLGEIASASTPGSTLAVVAGTSALAVSETSQQSAVSSSQTIRIMDYSDPKNPKVAREFDGVTAVSRDDSRGLIFVANTDGIWILRKHFAQDPKADETYEHYVLYGSSMYY